MLQIRNVWKWDLMNADCESSSFLEIVSASLGKRCSIFEFDILPSHSMAFPPVSLSVSPLLLGGH